MLGQFFGYEKITRLEKVSTTQVRLPSGSHIRLGGLGATLGELTLDTSIVGAGGLESLIVNPERYYVYVVLDGGIEKLIASTSEVKPAAFDIYRKVGAFYTAYVDSDITQVLHYGSPPRDVSVRHTLSADQTITTSVNKFLSLDTSYGDESKIVQGWFVYIPEDGYYWCSATVAITNLNSGDYHTSKIFVSGVVTGAVATNRWEPSTTNMWFTQPIPKTKTYLYKGDSVALNVDAGADSNYLVAGNSGGSATYLSVEKIKTPNDINWD